MTPLQTRIEQLPPMHVASVRVVSESPELDAWNRLRRWAEPRGLLRDPHRHPVFGFNNPPPRAGHFDYGYEWWIRVAADTPADDEVQIKEFEGGTFLVATCRLLGDPAGTVGDVWMKLWRLGRTGPYRWSGTQELEKPRDPTATEREMLLDLYLPVRAVAPAPGGPVSARPVGVAR